jgi:pyridoxal phosphate enzyme (YggS family)
VTADARRAELEANLHHLHDRIAVAARDAGRDPEEIHLVVVTKTFPASDILLLAELGVRDIGENRHPEAADKAAALADLDLVWHFIGQLQSNKATHVAAYADVVHSVDSLKLVRRLEVGARDHGRQVSCLIQLSLDPPDRAQGRAGAGPGDVAAIADAIEGAQGLRLGGMMGVAPLDAPPEPAFERLADAWHAMRRDHPQATMLSAGMSDDFPAAIEAGATHVRVGSAVMGRRPPLR